MNSKHLFFNLAVCLLVAGCAAGHQTVYQTDPQTGKTEKTLYSPSFISDIIEIDKGVYLRVTGFNEEKKNPLTYPLAKAAGALGPDDMHPRASYMVHLKNDSGKNVAIELISLSVDSATYPFAATETIVGPGGDMHSELIMGTYSEWDREQQIAVVVDFLLNNQRIKKEVILNRETLEEFNRRMGR